jgi:hypothetical protein
VVGKKINGLYVEIRGLKSLSDVHFYFMSIDVSKSPLYRFLCGAIDAAGHLELAGSRSKTNLQAEKPGLALIINRSRI